MKKARMLEIGDSILLPIPEVDKRSPFEPPNFPGVITHRSEEGYYKIGTQAGTLDRCYLSTEFEFSHSSFLSPEEVPGSIVTLRKAILLSSLGCTVSTPAHKLQYLQLINKLSAVQP